MAYVTTETLTVQTACGNEIELQFECVWQYSEPDVGIMADYIGYLELVAVNGSTRHANWAAKIMAKYDDAIIEKIYDKF